MKSIRILLLGMAAACLLAACKGNTPAGSPAGRQNPARAVSAVAGTTPMTPIDTEGSLPDTTGIDLEVPTIRLLSKGSILPSKGSLDLVFGSVSYAQAEVRVKKVFSSNILRIRNCFCMIKVFNIFTLRPHRSLSLIN